MIEIVVEPTQPAKKKAKKKYKPISEARREAMPQYVQKPMVLKNRALFRDQLTANGMDLVGAILSNIAMLPPKEQLPYQMKLLKYAYNELEAVPIVTEVERSELPFQDSIDVEAKDVTGNDFTKMLKQI